VFYRFLILFPLFCPYISLLFHFFLSILLYFFLPCNLSWGRSFILEVNQSMLKTLFFCFKIKTACFTREWGLLTGCSRNKLTGAGLTEEDYDHMNNLSDRD
jgi:hypothetical protein